jgi:hypothetical protein
MGPALQRAPSAHPCHYERRRPEETILYQLVQENLECFLAKSKPRVEAACRSLFKAEFDGFLACGILAPAL